ncbi:very short patch repair endonuclease [Paraburkholderia sp. MM5482-R1]|uniref:very short patch repair endonuclease n=1 Tax=unclassified Paraburkholderia TaxID=2615204 RepID=UPI003D1DC79F
MDRLTTEQRSRLMARIRGKDTKPEWIVRRLVHGMGYRYVLHDRRLPGTPDLVFPSRQKIIFIHGCFWHGHDCARGFKPKTNTAFWTTKIATNKARDVRQCRELRERGWKVLTVWECTTHPTSLASLKRRLSRFLES